MKNIAHLVFILLLFLLAAKSQAQDISGIWRGYFLTDGGEQYKYEVQLDQTKKNSLSGVTYSYLDTRFYGKATFTGNYTKASNAALVQEIKTVELRMAGGSVACIMKCRLIYSRSGREEFLEGLYTSGYEKNDPLNGIRRGGDCGSGKVFLRKVATSDFYIEPFLRKKTKAQTPRTDTARTSVAKKPATAPPVAKRPAPKKDPPAVKKLEKPAPSTAETPKPDLATPSKPVITPKIPVTPTIIRDRKNELTRTINLINTEVEISLYDNGEVDNDTISVYYNGQLLLSNQRLSNKPIKLTLKVNEAQPEATLVMVAENLGRIPPNTSLMIIQDGDKRHQVSITSTEQKNAMVRFRYERELP
jgi:hypothetical protein